MCVSFLSLCISLCLILSLLPLPHSPILPVPLSPSSSPLHPSRLHHSPLLLAFILLHYSTSPTSLLACHSWSSVTRSTSQQRLSPICPREIKVLWQLVWNPGSRQDPKQGPVKGSPGSSLPGVTKPCFVLLRSAYVTPLFPLLQPKAGQSESSLKSHAPVLRHGFLLQLTNPAPTVNRQGCMSWPSAAHAVSTFFGLVSGDVPS